MDITVNDYEVYKRLINFLETDKVDYATVVSSDEYSVKIQNSEISEEIKYIIKPDSILSLFKSA